MTKTLLALATASAAIAAAPAARADSYAIDPNHTAVIFEIDHFATSTNRGRIPGKDGKVELDKAAKAGRLEVTLDMAGVTTGVASLEQRLKGKDLFDVEHNPSAKFVADKLAFAGDKVSEISGTLTLMGKTNPVTLKATRFNCYTSPMLKREVCGGDFETTIQRSQWGLSWGSNFGFPDDVKLVVQAEAVNQTQK